MDLRREEALDLVGDTLVDDANAQHPRPRESFVYQKLRLFALFYRRVTPVGRLHGGPVNELVKFCQVIGKAGVSGTGISV